MGIEKKNVARMFEQETLILETNAVIMKLDIWLHDKKFLNGLYLGVVNAAWSW